MNAVTLILPLPPSVNAAFANVPGKGRVKKKAYRQWVRQAQSELWPQKPAGGFPCFSGSFSVHITVPLTMRGDIDNRMKAAIDFLKKPAAIISDDKHTQGASISRSSDVAPGTCKITVYETPARAA